MDSHNISIVIPSRNVKDDLQKCLGSVFKIYTNGEIEVIVSDSNSTDGTAEMIAEHFPMVKVCGSDEAGSYAASINRGIKVTTGKFIMFLDSDAIMLKQTAPGLLNFLQTHPDVGAVVCKVFYPDGSVQLTPRRNPTLLGLVFGRESILNKFFPRNKISRNYLMLDELERDEPFEVDWASSACMVIKRDVLEKVGFMDEGYPFYWTDADFCRRVKNSGWKIYYVPQAEVVHDMRNNPDKKKSTFMIRSFHYGIYRYFRKHSTKSAFNPLNLILLIGLSVRAALLILLNAVKSDKSVDK